MHKIEPITIILINSKFTHHHRLLIHSFHSLLTLMSHCHTFHNTHLLTVHLLIARSRVAKLPAMHRKPNCASKTETVTTTRHQRKLQNNRLDKEYYNLDENELLTRKVIDGGHEFHAIYLPSVLIFQVLRTAHDDLGHNGFPRTYAALK